MEDIRLRFPDNYIGITRGFTSSHKGIDLGWNTNYGGPNCNIYAPMEGEVIFIEDGKDNTYSSGIASWGNYVKIKHTPYIYTLMAHLLKGSISESSINIGSIVKQGQKIGRMNNSGYSNGSHLHYEVYIGGADISFRVDPLLYTYIFKDQVVSPNTVLKDRLRYYVDNTSDEKDLSIKEAYAYMTKAMAILKPYVS